MILAIPQILITFLLMSIVMLVPAILYYLWVYLFTLAFNNPPSDWFQIILLATILFYSLTTYISIKIKENDDE